MLEMVNAVRFALVEKFRRNNCIPDIPASVLMAGMSDFTELIHNLCDSVGWDMFDFSVISGEIQTEEEVFNWWFESWVRYVQVCYTANEVPMCSELTLVTITHKQYMEIKGW